MLRERCVIRVARRSGVVAGPRLFLQCKPTVLVELLGMTALDRVLDDLARPALLTVDQMQQAGLQRSEILVDILPPLVESPMVEETLQGRLKLDMRKLKACRETWQSALESGSNFP